MGYGKIFAGENIIQWNIFIWNNISHSKYFPVSHGLPCNIYLLQIQLIIYGVSRPQNKANQRKYKEISKK